MGYRNYLYIIDKDKLEQSRNLKKEDIKYFKQSIEDKIFEWTFIETKPDNKYNLTSSWKYEYEYFTLLHILSITDSDKQTFLWLGW